MGREEKSEETNQCDKCGRSDTETTWIYACDACNKEIDTRKTYLEASVHRRSDVSANRYYFDEWKCYVKWLSKFKPPKGMWFMSLPYVQKNELETYKSFIRFKK